MHTELGGTIKRLCKCVDKDNKQRENKDHGSQEWCWLEVDRLWDNPDLSLSASTENEGAPAADSPFRK